MPARVRRAAVAATLLLALVPARPAPAARPITIGLASSFDFVRDWTRDGARFAVDEINARGGVLGRPLRLLAEQDPALGDRAVKRLLAAGVDALIGPEVWTATQSNDQAIRNRRVINVLPLSPSGEVNVLRNPYVFRMIPYDAIQAEALVDFLARTKGLRRFAVLHSDDFLGREGAGEVRERLRLLGMQPAYESTFNIGDTDMSAQVLGARRASADALVVWGLAREAARVAIAARNLSWGVQIAGPVEAIVGDYVDLAGSKADGTVSVLPHRTIRNWAPPGSWRANWFARYHRRFTVRAFRGTKVPNLPVAQAAVYDAVRLVAGAMRIAGSTDGEAVRRVLESGRVFPLVTNDFRFSPGNHESYAAGDLWAFRIARGAVNFDIDPRADRREETEAWQLFAAGLLFDRKRGVAFIPYSIGTFRRGEAVRVGALRWTAVRARFAREITVRYFDLPPRKPKGRWAIVHVRLTNVSGRTRRAPWTFALDQDGNLSLPDSQAMAGLWIDGGPAATFFMFQPVPAGGTLEGDFVFDVPATAREIQVGVPDDFIFRDYAMVRMGEVR
ncbi:MAG: ABC transporter substrate-binding protein [Acidobacteria bacterium]|nr:ABC transporter substrate-binding protein [Acidobacteriota bacterium]